MINSLRDDCMASVVADVESANSIIFGCNQINDFAFAFVAPLWATSDSYNNIDK